jgi:putative transposase
MYYYYRMTTPREAKKKPERLLAQKVRVHLNNRQERWMAAHCAARRIAYNFAVDVLSQQKSAGQCFVAACKNTPTLYSSRIDGIVQPALDPWAQQLFTETGKRKFPDSVTVSKIWTEWRDSLRPWMKAEGLDLDAISSSAFYGGYKAALKNWKRANYAPDHRPTFQSKKRGLSITFRGRELKKTGKKTGNPAFDLPRKMGRFRIGCQLRCDGEIRSVTFSKESNGKWYAAFLMDATKMPVPEQAPAGTAVGVDVGVKNFVAMSDGTLLPPAMDFNREHAKLARLQRVLSRMQGPVKSQRKASNNWKKQNARVNRQEHKIASKRRDYIERQTAILARNFQIVAIEDLKVKNMTKSAKGTADEPGKNVAAKAGLNRAILQGGFGMFRTRLEAKVAARKGEVRAVNPAHTSQTCNACGHVAKANRPEQAEFKCVACGHEDHADLNAAKNILFRALTSAEPVEPSPPDDVNDSGQQGTSSPVSLPTEPVGVLAQEAVAQDASCRTHRCDGKSIHSDNQRLAIRRKKKVNAPNQLDFFYSSTG